MSSEDFVKLLFDIQAALPLVLSFSSDETHTNLSSLINKINSLKLPELTSETLQSSKLEFSTYIGSLIKQFTDLTPRDVIDKYIKRIHEYGFQGGFGHYVSGNQRFPCHWVIYPVYYELCKPVPIERLCFLVDDRIVAINPIAEKQHWGN